MARTRYTFFSQVAESEGYHHIAALFQETADNEREHAKRFFKLLKGEGNQVHVQFEVPAVPIGRTAENLKAAADGEFEEHSNLYPRWARIAEEEGLSNIARVFLEIASVEREHEKRFRSLLRQVEEGTVFKREREVSWKCRNCGYIFVGTQAPQECPACGHEQGWYQIVTELE
jgi:rubrerythrin